MQPLSQPILLCARKYKLLPASAWLADYVGALCCVNIVGAAARVWGTAATKEKITRPETYEANCIESVRAIIDAVKPKRAKYAPETMPWMDPDSPESYLRLIADIDRPQLGVHLDVVNLD